MPSSNVDLTLRVNMKSDVNRELKSLESSVIRTVGAITAALATIQAILFPVTNAIAFERAMADVAKTTGYSKEQIDSLSVSLNDMSKELGIAAIDLANVAAIAGQLGLGNQGREAIEQFTASVARASVTLGLSVEKTAEGGAQLSAIFGKSVSEVEKVFATINELSNNSVAAGGDLIDIMKRVGTTSGATFEQVAALAATVRQLGVPNEQAGTGLVKYLGNLLAESKKFSTAMGLTQDDWVEKVKDNSVDALKYVLKQISEMGSAQQAANIKELFGSGRLFALGDKLVGDAEQDFATLNRMLGLSVDGYREGTSSIQEYNRIMETTSKQIDVLKASFVSIGIKAGNQALPAIQRAIESLSRALQNDEVITYFENIGQSLGDMVDWLADGTRKVNEWVDAWENVVNIFKLFLAFKLGTMFVGWAVKLTLVLAAFRAIVAQVAVLNTMMKAMHLHMINLAIASKAAGTSMASSSLALVSGAAAVNVTKLGAAIAFLGKMTRAVTGPLGTLVGIIGYYAYANWGKIMSFLGFVDAEKLKAEREAKEVEKQRKEGLKKAVAEAKEAGNKIDNIMAAIPNKSEIRLTLNTDDAKKELELLLQNTVDAQDAINKSQVGGEASGLLRTDGFKEYNQAIEDLKKAEEELAKAREGKAGITRRGKATLVADPEGVAESLKLLEIIRAKVAVFEKEAAKNSENIAQASLVESKANDKLKRNMEELTKTYNVQTAAYIRLVQQYKQAESNVSLYRSKLIELNKIQAGVKLEDQQSADYRARALQISELEDQLGANEKAAALYTESATKYLKNLSVLERESVAPIAGKSLQYVTDLTQVFDKLNLSNVDNLTKSLIDNNGAIIFNYLQLAKVEEGYKRMSSAADAYKKRAKASFDNVNNEISAMRLGIAKFGRELQKSLVTRRSELKLDIKIEDLDEDLQKAKDKVNKFYDDLEDRPAQSGPFIALNNNQGREADLADLENQHAWDKAYLESQALLEKYNREIANSTKLMEEAKKAAAEGNLDKFLSLKDASKRSLESARGLIDDMKDVRTIDVFGEDSFKFNDNQINDMFDKTVDVGTELESGLRIATTKMNDEAIKSAKIYSELLKGASEALAGPANEIANLSKLPGFGKILESATKMFNDSTSDLSGVLNAFTDGSFTPFETLNTFDPEEFKQKVKDAVGNGAAEGFAEALKNLPEAKLFDDTTTEYNTRDTNVTITADIDKTLDDMEDAISRRWGGGLEVPTTPTFDIVPGTEADEINQAFAEEFNKGEPIKVPIDADITKMVNTVEQQQFKLKDVEATLSKIIVDKATEQSIELQLNAILKPTSTTQTVAPIERALGGPVFGPGSGTSDSIPAWLSNGEWVMDAVTTSFFGGSFFAGLQAMARGGRKPSMKGGIPAFAGGGAVSGAESVGSVTLNIGGSSYTLYGERQQAKELVDTFKRMGRG